MGTITKRTALGRTRHANFSLGLDIGSHSNARCQLLPEAGARHERTLEAVGSRPLFGHDVIL
jgi:hypothetical protein